MARYPLWKSLIMLGVLIFSFVYSLPNLFPDDPAVQISGAQASRQVTQDTLERALAALKTAGIETKDSVVEKGYAMIRFRDGESQLRARELVQDALAGEYVAALNLAPTTPAWLSALGASPIKLGLDLRGGVHFVLEVDMEKAIKTRMGAHRDELRDKFRTEKIFYRQVKEFDQGLEFTFANDEARQKAVTLLKREYRQFVLEEKDDGAVFSALVKLTPDALKEIQDMAISQNLTGLRNRVNQLGVSEAVVVRQGVDRIVVQLPGVQDTAAVKRIIGRTANLEFRLVHRANATGTTVPSDAEKLPMKSAQREVILERKVIVTGDRVVGAQSGFDENSMPQVSIDLDSAGGRMMSNTTRKHVKDQMAVVFIELKPELIKTLENGKEVRKQVIRETREVINVATIQSVLGSSFRITGLDSPAEASELALLLRAGALAAPMYFVAERTVGPSLGEENIQAGIKSLIVGFMAVAVFMVVYNKMFGVIANLALFFNLMLLVAVLSVIPGAALSLPGMAGLVLTVGMAVDANVLINARIQEELRKGASPVNAIKAGYDRAWITILDSNITTFIVGLVLFIFGSGPVRGFAVVLCLGIITSMYTAVSGSRVLVSLIYGGSNIKKISV